MEYYFRKRVSVFVAVGSAGQALRRLNTEAFDVILCDYLLSDMDVIRFLEMLEEMYPGVKRVLITSYPDHEVESRARKIGVSNFIRKPLYSKDIESSLARLNPVPLTKKSHNQ